MAKYLLEGKNFGSNKPNFFAKNYRLDDGIKHD